LGSRTGEGRGSHQGALVACQCGRCTAARRAGRGRAARPPSPSSAPWEVSPLPSPTPSPRTSCQCAQLSRAASGRGHSAHVPDMKCAFLQHKYALECQSRARGRTLFYLTRRGRTSAESKADITTTADAPRWTSGAGGLSHSYPPRREVRPSCDRDLVAAHQGQSGHAPGAVGPRP
jgi:hypothetical protein